MDERETIDVSFLLRSLEQALRAGYSLRQAVVRVAEDIDGLDSLANDITGEGDLLASFTAWAESRPEPDALLVSAVVRLQLEDEGNLADKMGLLSRILDRR